MAPRTVSPILLLWLALAVVAGAPAMAAPSEPAPASPASRSGDVAHFGRPAARIFTGTDGLPQNSLVSMAFDAKGYLWVGTQDGAATYNGRTWSVTNLPNREISNMIRAVFVASDGAIWFGRQDGGAARFVDGRWELLDVAAGLPDNRVHSIAETVGAGGAPAIWLATSSGLARYAEGRLRTITLDGRPGANAIRQVATVSQSDGSQRLYAATGAGIWSLDHDGRATEVWHGDGLGGITCLAPLAGELWVGVHGGKLVRLEDGRAEVVRTYRGADIYCLMATPRRDGGHDLWIGTDGEGLERFDGETWTRYDSQNLLPSETVWSLSATGPADEPSTVWVGTDGGLVRLEPGLWLGYDQRTGLPSNSAYSLLVTFDDDGGQSLWAGLRGTGMVRLKNGVATVYDTDDGLTSNSVFALHESNSSSGGRTLWVGTQGGGLGTFANGRFTRMPVRGPTQANTIRRFLEVQHDDGSRTLWAASGDAGLLRYDGSEWTTFGVESGLESRSIFSLEHSTTRDGGEALWVGTQGHGVARLQNGTWSAYGLDSGLLNLSILGLHVSRFADGRRLLWAGTEGGGVSILDLRNPEAGWTTLTETTSPAIPNNTVYQVLSDARDRVYLFTNKGVARLTPRQGASPGEPTWDVARFTAEDGLPSNEFNGGASHKDALGRIWAGTVAGVTMFDPAREPAARAPSPLYVERQYLSDDGKPFAEGQELRYSENSLTFEFALLSYYREGGSQYRTQLLGIEHHPSEWTTRHTKDYTTLPAGAYTFRVWARDSLGVVTGPVEVPFTVLPAPWLTWWAFAAYAAAVAALALGGVRWRERTLRRRNAELESRITERTAELAEKSSALSAKVRELEISERAASQAREEALEANRAKSTFLSNMSHELRTPLNAVLGFAQLMERDADRSDEDRQSLAVISRSGEHLLQLINDVLSISKIEAGRLTLNEEAFDLSRMLQSVEDMMRGRAHAKGIALEFELAPGTPRVVRGDEGKLRQVLINLLGNAVKFTESGGVALRARWDEGTARFEVEDTGPGIAPAELETVFDAFVQTDSGRKSKEGTGLGLAITRSFVELMGGRISAESTIGTGTTFGIEVPLAEADASLLRGERARVVSVAPGTPETRILVADDKWENRAVLARLLRSVGLDVREAANGREALETWRDWAPRLIWMDMRMPVMDGPAATRAIREEEATRLATRELRASATAAGGDGGAPPLEADPMLASRTVIVALSASAFEHERDVILASGCDDFVAKPYREETIFDRLATHLGLAFVRADEGLTRSESAPSAHESALTVERLAALPTAWVAELESALVTGNVKAVGSAVEQIALQDEPLAEELRAAVKRYDFDALLDLLERMDP